MLASHIIKNQDGLIFQMEMYVIKEDYGVDGHTLKVFQFNES